MEYSRSYNLINEQNKKNDYEEHSEFNEKLFILNNTNQKEFLEEDFNYKCFINDKNDIYNNSENSEILEEDDSEENCWSTKAIEKDLNFIYQDETFKKIDEEEIEDNIKNYSSVSSNSADELCYFKNKKGAKDS